MTSWGMTEGGVEKLVMEPVGGPTTSPVVAQPPGPVTIGRQPGCDIRLIEDESVSRRHAQLLWRAERWFIEDLGSRHGTRLNAEPLQPGRPAPLTEGDFVQLGASTLRIRPGSTRASMTTVTGEVEPMAPVRPLTSAGLAGLDRLRLDLFLEVSAALGQAEDHEAWTKSLLTAALRGTGYARAAILRWSPGSRLVDVHAFAADDPTEGPDGWKCSVTLLEQASRGQMVGLDDTALPSRGESIVRLHITSAMCAPIRIGEAITAYLYLDARGGESAPSDDAAGFCDGLAKLWGIGQTVHRQRERARHEEAIRRDLQAAQEVQNMILPPTSGEVGGLQYAMEMRPGRIVAGDMFDIFELSDGRVAIIMGDVESKGAGAAMVMAIAQTHLRATLWSLGGPAESVRRLCRRLPVRGEGGRTITLWVGVYDPAAGRLTFCVAGHGYWLHGGPDAAPSYVRYEGGPPIGTYDDYEYRDETLAVGKGDRIVLYSDGVAEQPGGEEGRLFGLKRVEDALRDASGSPEDVVCGLFELVVEYAGTSTLADDTTVACIRIGR